MDITPYQAAGGDDGLRRLAEAWHQRALADPVVSHAFSHGFHPDHSERLATYWAEALGGPARYTAEYGDETTVVKMHAGNGAHPEMDDRAIATFAAALDDVGLADPVRQLLFDYFSATTRGAMAAYPHSPDDVPPNLPLPTWSWDGPVLR